MNDMRFGREVRWLFQTALLMFLVTISLGLARGLDLISFENHNQALTHLHSGTIGWITLGIFAAVLWLYGGNEPRRAGDGFVTLTVLILVVAVPIYLLAWWTGNLPFRAVTGSAVLLGIVMYVGWVVREASRTGYRRLTTPRLGVAIGLVTLVVGSTLGVLLQIQFASQASLLPEAPSELMRRRRSAPTWCWSPCRWPTGAYMATTGRGAARGWWGCCSSAEPSSRSRC